MPIGGGAAVEPPWAVEAQAETSALAQRVTTRLMEIAADMHSLLPSIEPVSQRAHDLLQVALQNFDGRLRQGPLEYANPQQTRALVEVLPSAYPAIQRLAERSQHRRGAEAAAALQRRLEPLHTAALGVQQSMDVVRLLALAQRRHDAVIAQADPVLASAGAERQAAAQQQLFVQAQTLVFHVHKLLDSVRAVSETAARHVGDGLRMLTTTLDELRSPGADTASWDRLPNALDPRPFEAAHDRLTQRIKDHGAAPRAVEALRRVNDLLAELHGVRSGVPFERASRRGLSELRPPDAAPPPQPIAPAVVAPGTTGTRVHADAALLEATRIRVAQQLEPVHESVEVALGLGQRIPAAARRRLLDARASFRSKVRDLLAPQEQSSWGALGAALDPRPFEAAREALREDLHGSDVMRSNRRASAVIDALHRVGDIVDAFDAIRSMVPPDERVGSAAPGQQASDVAGSTVAGVHALDPLTAQAPTAWLAEQTRATLRRLAQPLRDLAPTIGRTSKLAQSHLVHALNRYELRDAARPLERATREQARDVAGALVDGASQARDHLLARDDPGARRAVQRLDLLLRPLNQYVGGPAFALLCSRLRQQTEISATPAQRAPVPADAAGLREMQAQLTYEASALAAEMHTRLPLVRRTSASAAAALARAVAKVRRALDDERSPQFDPSANRPDALDAAIEGIDHAQRQLRDRAPEARTAVGVLVDKVRDIKESPAYRQVRETRRIVAARQEQSREQDPERLVASQVAAHPDHSTQLAVRAPYEEPSWL